MTDTKASARVILPAEPTKEMCEAAPSLPAIHAVDDLPLGKAGWSMAAIQNLKRYRAMTKDAPTLDQHTLAVIEFMKERCASALCEFCKKGAPLDVDGLHWPKNARGWVACKAREFRYLDPAALLAEIKERGL